MNQSSMDRGTQGYGSYAASATMGASGTTPIIAGRSPICQPGIPVGWLPPPPPPTYPQPPQPMKQQRWYVLQMKPLSITIIRTLLELMP